MALGGGTFVTQNKILPGSYINFVSLRNNNITLTDRGIVAFGLELDFFEEDKIINIEKKEFLNNSFEIFGFNYNDSKLKKIRELFIGAKTALIYPLSTDAVKATNDFATAKKAGIRGNDLTIIITNSVQKIGAFNVILKLDNKVLDNQIVETATDLKDNDFVIYNKEAVLSVTAGTKLAGGTNGTVTGQTHLKFLSLLENEYFNILGTDTTDDDIKRTYIEYTKRMREEQGIKFQSVVYNYKADYEGVINVKNEVNAVYFVSGILAGCEINKSTLNTKYDGEYEIQTNYTQIELEKAIKNGEFTLHKVGDDIRVLADINSLVTETVDKNKLFKNNQTIRVIDQIATDIASIFNNKYLGNIQNNESGRLSLWTDIVKHHEQLLKIGAIENFKDDDIVIYQGETKQSVVIQDNITIVNAMSQIYMSVQVG